MIWSNRSFGSDVLDVSNSRAMNCKISISLIAMSTLAFKLSSLMIASIASMSCNHKPSPKTSHATPSSRWLHN